MEYTFFTNTHLPILAIWRAVKLIKKIQTLQSHTAFSDNSKIKLKTIGPARWLNG